MSPPRRIISNVLWDIEANRVADIIAVQGDPLDDISELDRVRFVMKGGTLIKNEFNRK